MIRNMQPIPPGPDAAQPMAADGIAAVMSGSPDPEGQADDSPIVGELIELGDENTKHFRHENGTLTAAMYTGPVRFRNAEGAWQDIDMVLDEGKRSASGEATYVPAASELDIQIPQDFADGQKLTIGKDGFTVGMGVKVREEAAIVQPGEDTISEPLEEGLAIAEEETVAAEGSTEASPVEEEQTAPELDAEDDSEKDLLALEGGEENIASTEEANAVPEDQPVSEEPVVGKAIDLSTVKAEVNNDLAAVAEPEEPAIQTAAEKVRAENAKKMTLDKLTSSVIYRDIFPGADLEFINLPTQIKENIYIKEIQDEYIYLFDLSFDGLTAVPQEDGSIYLYADVEDEKPLFILEAPYMYDAAGEESTALAMTLAEDGTLTLAADAEWINDEARVLPIVIDPTLTAPQASSIEYMTVGDGTLANTNLYGLTSHYFAGQYDGHNYRTYVKFDLPQLPSGSVAVAAHMAVFMWHYWEWVSGNPFVVYDAAAANPANTIPWNATDPNVGITWNTQPLHSEINGPRGNLHIVDFQAASNYSTDNGIHYYTFDVTKSVKNWYECGNNNGLMITPYDETGSTSAAFYTPVSLGGQGPVLQIEYNTNVGLEPYWSYETFDMGRSGTAYVNHYNGNMTWVHNDISMTGNRLPINISHVYNTDHADPSPYTPMASVMKLGKGFRLSIMEKFVSVLSDNEQYSLWGKGYRYKFIDSDGTAHYFKEQANGDITHEYDTSQVLTEAMAFY